MKKYNYKIQWLLNRNQVMNTTHLKQILNIIGVRSLDIIKIKDENLKEIDRYTNFISFPYGLAERETSKYIRQVFKHNNEAFYVELLKR